MADGLLYARAIRGEAYIKYNSVVMLSEDRLRIGFKGGMFHKSFICSVKESVAFFFVVLF